MRRTYKGVPLADRMDSQAGDSKEMRDLRCELKESEEWRHRLHSEVKDLESKNLWLQRRRIAMFDSLSIERGDLVARVQRIDQRIASLGLDAAGAEAK